MKTPTSAPPRKDAVHSRSGRAPAAALCGAGDGLVLDLPELRHQPPVVEPRAADGCAEEGDK